MNFELRTLRQDWLLGLGTGEAPTGMAAEGIGKELKASAAGIALKIVFHCVGGPLRIEEVAQRTGAFHQSKHAFVDEMEKAVGEFQVFARLLEALAFEELIASGTRRHGISVTPSRSMESISKVLG